MSLHAKALVLCGAGFFALMGLYSLWRPTGVLQMFGVNVETADGRTEVRAVYGGYGLAVAGVLVYAARTGSSLGSGVLLAVAVSLAGMAAGRLLGAGISRSLSLFPTGVFLAVEGLLAALLLLARRG